jgi:hypothetical protein
MNARITACVFALLCGCATAPDPAATGGATFAQPEAAAETRTGELIAYFASVAKAAAPTQKKELAQSAAAFGRTPTPYARLRLGGLYAQPAPVLRDDARALALLEPLAMANAMPERPVADLAALLYAQVAERQRLAKDEARKQDDLRERLEAMRSIERSIMDREDRRRGNEPRMTRQ